MNETVIQFEKFNQLQENDCQQKIIDAKLQLKDKLVILGHHYQNAGHASAGWQDLHGPQCARRSAGYRAISL